MQYFYCYITLYVEKMNTSYSITQTFNQNEMHLKTRKQICT